MTSSRSHTVLQVAVAAVLGSLATLAGIVAGGALMRFDFALGPLVVRSQAGRTHPLPVLYDLSGEVIKEFPRRYARVMRLNEKGEEVWSREVKPCGGGERMHVVDLDCDGNMDADPNIPLNDSGDLMMCFYAEGRTPTPEQQAVSAYRWTTPLQARLGPVGGDKTVSFSIDVITAVELAAFDATPEANGMLLSWETASEIDNLGFNIYRAESQVGQLSKINPHMIASQNLCGAAGAT